MTKRHLLSIIFITFCLNFSFSQVETANADTASKISASKKIASSETSPATSSAFIPWVGLGAGLFTFYGDVNNKNLVTPQQSRIAYDLSISKGLNSFLNLNFYTLFGKMEADERNSTERNLNFQTQVRMGGLNLSYNFDHLLPKKRSIEPYISIGFESFEFLSKTDLYDAKGNKYYYWSDGSIRSFSETDPNASNAIPLVRDYKYESDIREQNNDGFGKYTEQSWAVPLGAGATIHVSDKIRFKIGATLHYTFTDYVDGITNNSKGIRQGDSRNDMFLMTSFSLHYDLGSIKGKNSLEDTLRYAGVDWYALDMEDGDGDGVKDPEDTCQGTPAGTLVDVKGCPLDNDSDGVANYADKQLDTPPNSVVDNYGILQDDSLIAKRWKMYSDTTNEFLEKDVVVNPVVSWMSMKPKKYFTVKVASYTSNIAADVMGKLLTVPDIESAVLPDSSTIYTAGIYLKASTAEIRKTELQQLGFSDASVVYKDSDNYIAVVEKQTTPADTNINTNNTINNLSSTTNSSSIKNPLSSIPSISDDGTVMRVQLGAYKKPLSKNIFKQVPELVLVKSEDGLYKYLSGSFKSASQASKHRAMLIEKGYKGAFVVAYKGGKKVPLPVQGNSSIRTNLKGVFDPKDPTDPTKLSFDVQVGVFKNSPPGDIQKKFNAVKSIHSEITEAGLTRYVSGSFVDYITAEKHKDELIKQGFEDAFIIAYFNEKIIPIQDALLILKSY